MVRGSVETIAENREEVLKYGILTQKDIEIDSNGCKNYEKCSFKISGTICKRIISIENAKLLLETGKTSKIEGFISKTGKTFNATLKFDVDKKIVFDFN